MLFGFEEGRNSETRHTHVIIGKLALLLLSVATVMLGLDRGSTTQSRPTKCGKTFRQRQKWNEVTGNSPHKVTSQKALYTEHEM